MNSLGLCFFEPSALSLRFISGSTYYDHLKLSETWQLGVNGRINFPIGAGLNQMTEEGLTAISNIARCTEVTRFILTLPLIHRQLKALDFTIYSPQAGAEQRTKKASSQSTPDRVREFQRHDPQKNEDWTIPADDLTSECLNQKISRLPRDRALAIKSRCNLLDGCQAHIPMMDFKPPPSHESLKLIRESLTNIGQTGIILESGASYHFYGFDLLKQEDWLIFIGNCLLAPYSDSRWIGHSLVSRNSTLRITASQCKRQVPFVRDILL